MLHFRSRGVYPTGVTLKNGQPTDVSLRGGHPPDVLILSGPPTDIPRDISHHRGPFTQHGRSISRELPRAAQYICAPKAAIFLNLIQ